MSFPLLAWQASGCDSGAQGEPPECTRIEECDDALACTQDVCDIEHTCQHALAAGFCLIAGVCVPEEAPDPADACSTCDPAQSTTGWSPATGRACDDGDACTRDDTCGPPGCAGESYACDDQIECTADGCDGAGGCTFTMFAGYCLISSQCWSAGQSPADNPCQTCVPELRLDGWSSADQAACDDLDACTFADHCQDQTCAGTQYSCDDDEACTLDTCLGDGTCRNDLVEEVCIIDGACVPGGAPHPADACQACLPAVDPDHWSQLDPGSACDDGDACSSGDQCLAGTCQGTPYGCGDDLDCTEDLCLGDGTCSNVLSAGACVIEGVCRAADEPNPTNPCETCAPDSDPGNWSALPDDSPCEDGDPCSIDDACHQGVCEGDAFSCDDGLLCTEDVCDGAGGCEHPLVAGHCLIDATCRAHGEANPSDPCEACDATAPQAWSPNDGASCSDDDPCTSGDLCTGGACTGEGYTCDDGLECTADTCDGAGGCSFSVEAGRCSIGGACWDDGQENPANPCEACDSSTPGAWAPLTGLPCDDGDPCTRMDSCSLGACLGISYSCDDGLDCTADTCDGVGGCSFSILAGRCRIGGVCWADGDPRPGYPCQECDAADSPQAWSSLPNGTSCDDVNVCTTSSTCQNGSCAGAGLISCDDGLTCTDDDCDSLSGCFSTVLPGTCLLGGACFTDGQTNPANPCEACDATAPQVWSPNDGAPCSDGDPCTSGDLCAGGTCAGEPIIDGFEPNETLASARDLGSVTSATPFPADLFTATLYGQGDLDWYRFRVTEALWSAVRPRAELRNIPAGSNYALCLYAACVNPEGVPSYSCTAGSPSSSGGYSGCCSDASGSANEAVELEPHCGGADDTVQVYLRASHTNGGWTCSPYQLRWGDN
ncbi:MAG TPA: hypothetical protein P5076_08365 [Myxococcota bacterium]|nr:hypothetical protein [Myxococcota bacterium]